MMKNRQQNQTFTLLSAIGILLILLGHLNFPLLTMGGLFPYYSFHVYLFVFISGYFYKTSDEEQIFAYVKRKCLHLLIPYFVWNFIYGLLSTLFHGMGMHIGENISLYNLFIAPFLSGHQFMYQAASWFVPALFLVELCNVFGRKILYSMKIRNEYVLMVIYLFIGLLAVWLAKKGSVYDYYKLPARIMMMAPVFEFGHLYKEKLESRDTLPSGIYFPLLFLIQFVIVWITGGQIAYSAVWVTGFAHSVFLPYLTTLTGIAFWLRVAKELTPVLKKNPFVMYVGTHTFDIMMHHLFGFFLVNCISALLSRVCEAFSAFDYSLLTTDIYYVYEPNGMSEWKWIYLAFGMLFPLLISRIQDKIAHLRALK